MTLAALSQEELAGHLWMRRTVDGGVRYARHAEPRRDKDRARQRVLFLCSQRFFTEGLSILTMPGMTWPFEHMLLANREGSRYERQRSPKRTFICAIEREEAIYRAAIRQMPGAEAIRDNAIVSVPSPSYATASIRTRLIQRYHRCGFEDMAAVTTEPRFDAAWLDFNGQLSEDRRRALMTFWETRVRTLLVVTLLNARTDAEMTARIDKAGSVGNLLRDSIGRAELIDQFRYNDTGSPMVQLMFSRRNTDHPGRHRVFREIGSAWAGEVSPRPVKAA